MICIWKAPWLRPLPFGKDISYSPSVGETDAIKFQLEPESFIHLMYNEPGELPYLYRCMSCYAASGSGNVFTTQPEKLQDLKDGPTEEQQKQMQDHAHQHSIMYLWARSVK